MICFCDNDAIDCNIYFFQISHSAMPFMSGNSQMRRAGIVSTTTLAAIGMSNACLHRTPFHSNYFRLGLPHMEGVQSSNASSSTTVGSTATSPSGLR